MAKNRVHYECTECGAPFPRWSGRCPNCEAWDSLVERSPAQQKPYARSRASVEARAFLLSELQEPRVQRFSTGIAEFDRVLGGGILPGSTIILGGEPGIGKSTILLQILGHVAAQDLKCLYVCCEESPDQVKLRAARLGIAQAPVVLCPETDLESICSLLHSEEPAIAVVDSIQMVHATGVDSTIGSLQQLKICGGELVALAKSRNLALFLVGHVTKSGAIAGPRALEHLVDTVLYFESDRFQTLRVLRAVKNRFGAVNEIGVFQMSSDGLQQVANPSELFLSERQQAGSGSVVVSTIEGTRALLVEIQALVGPTSYGTPERKASGADYRRFSMMLAVLERQAGVNLGGSDAFVNVAGGVRVYEPAADLALALALASSYRQRPFPADAIAVGEVGLGGEVRAVSRLEDRVREAQRLGFARALVPGSSRKTARNLPIELVPVRNLTEAIRFLERG